MERWTLNPPAPFPHKTDCATSTFRYSKAAAYSGYTFFGRFMRH
jgi:hypothetical protein